MSGDVVASEGALLTMANEAGFVTGHAVAFDKNFSTIVILMIQRDCLYGYRQIEIDDFEGC